MSMRSRVIAAAAAGRTTASPVVTGIPAFAASATKPIPVSSHKATRYTKTYYLDAASSR